MNLPVKVTFKESRNIYSLLILCYNLLKRDTTCDTMQNIKGKSSNFHIIYHTGKNTQCSDVPYHFNLEGHLIERDMKVCIIDFIYEHPESKKTKSLRSTIERNWIHRLHTMAPKGLNTLDNRYE